MIGALLPALLGLLGKIIPDAGAAAAAQSRLIELHAQGEMTELVEAVKVIVAEASGNFLQRSWRPILMLTFGGLIVARWFGWAAPNLSEAEYLELWGIVKLGLGGYVIGRSVEKIAPAIADALSKR